MKFEKPSRICNQPLSALTSNMLATSGNITARLEEKPNYYELQLGITDSIKRFYHIYIKEGISYLANLLRRDCDIKGKAHARFLFPANVLHVE